VFPCCNPESPTPKVQSWSWAPSAPSHLHTTKHTFHKKVVNSLKRFLQHFFHNTELSRVLCCIVQLDQRPCSSRINVPTDNVLL
jgi:hypothetical protein